MSQRGSGKRRPGTSGGGNQGHGTAAPPGWGPGLGDPTNPEYYQQPPPQRDVRHESRVPDDWEDDAALTPTRDDPSGRRPVTETPTGKGDGKGKRKAGETPKPQPGTSSQVEGSGQGEHKKRRLLPPTVQIERLSDRGLLGPEGAGGNDSRRFMVMADHEFPSDEWKKSGSSSVFIIHIQAKLQEAREARAIIRLPPKDAGDSAASETKLHRYHANTTAGEVMKLVARRQDQLEDMADGWMKALDGARAEVSQLRVSGAGSEAPQDRLLLGIGARHRALLMTKNLHSRYRTMWQLATNAGLIPVDDPDPSFDDARKMEYYRGFKIDLARYRGVKPHKSRYELCTALAHSGSFRDDLVTATSQYFEVWHRDGSAPRRALFRHMFETIYRIDIDTATWIAEAADYKKVEPAQEWIRLIDRVIFVTDYNYKTSLKKDSQGQFRLSTQDESVAVYNNHRVEELYDRWTAQIKKLVAKQKKKPPYQLYQLSDTDRVEIRRATRKFHDDATNQFRQSGVWNRYAHADRYPPWKPAETLQKKYDAFEASYDPFAPP